MCRCSPLSSFGSHKARFRCQKPYVHHDQQREEGKTAAKMPQIMEIEETQSEFDVSLKSLHLKEEDEELCEGENDEFDEEEDDEEEEDERDQPVTLGFVEKAKDPKLLLRHFFPSKAGGAPAWLDPINLPSGNSSVCGICSVPLQFLIQVYAPISDKESTFHRTLFVFVCPSMECLRKDQIEQRKAGAGMQSRSVKVFRCQLPRVNPFYSNEPNDAPIRAGAPLCTWCGTWKGEKVCGSCRRARYCSAKHQHMHWRAGHRNECQHMNLDSQTSAHVPTTVKANNSLNNNEKAASTFLWREYEIVDDDESTFNEMDMKEEKYESSLVAASSASEALKSLLSKFEGDEEKKHWADFQERISKAPDQVLRYCRDVKAAPLWPGLNGRPSKANIPNCSSCGGPRCFEFQVMSQLLYYFHINNEEDSLDWATIAVYSCATSCEASTSYCEEFPWVQLCSSST